METTRDTGPGGREQLQGKAEQVAGQAQEKVHEAAGNAKSRVREEVDQRSTDAGKRVQASASDIRSVGEELRKQGKDQPAKLADRLAERAEHVGGYLERSDGERILRDAEDLGRRRPWAVMLGGMAVGFAASRLLKASSEGRYEQRQAASGDLSIGQPPPQSQPPATGGTRQMAGIQP